MAKRKRPSFSEILETLLEDDPSESGKTANPVPPSTPLRSDVSALAHDAKGEESKTIIEVVETDGHLGAIIQRLLELGFLVPGPFHPRAYLRDTDRIESAWKKSKSKDNALAMGVHLNDEFFFEGVNAVRQKGDFIVSRALKAKLKHWETTVKSLFPNESGQIIEDAQRLGQYLEFKNRKAQGF